jgi:hypothetical protein
VATSFVVVDTLTIRDSLQLIEPGTAFTLNVDVLSQTDTLAAPTLGLTVLASDSISFTDTVIDTVKFALPFPLPLATPDRILLLDQVFVQLNAGGLGVSVSDLLNFRDLQTSQNTNSPGTGDSLALGDSLCTNSGWTVAPDSLSLSDSATNTLNSIFLNLSATAADALALSDKATLAVPGKLNLLSDSIALSDTISIAMTSNFLPYLRRYLNDV